MEACRLAQSKLNHVGLGTEDKIAGWHFVLRPDLIWLPDLPPKGTFSAIVGDHVFRDFGSSVPLRAGQDRLVGRLSKNSFVAPAAIVEFNGISCRFIPQ